MKTFTIKLVSTQRAKTLQIKLLADFSIIKKKKQNKLLGELNNAGIKSRPIWKPLHQLKIFESCKRDNCKNSEDVYKNTICLPSSPNISLK